MVEGRVYGSDFRIVRSLGAGGMGKVFVAEQVSTGKRRALKLLAPQLAADPRMREHFVLEAHAGAIVDSDHVVEVVAAGVEGEQPWLAMELLEGEDLLHRIERLGRLPLGEVAQIVRQLCHGLGAAHAKGLVHRDLKPENVFIAKSRRDSAAFTVKVLDFGIAKLTASKTETGQIGTPLWMAPEQMIGGAPAKPTADVWALGLLVYHALTGRSYWQGAREDVAMSGLLAEVLVHPIVPASVRACEDGVADALPPEFDGWFAACVARDPEVRFRDAAVAAGALADLLSTRRSSYPRMSTLPPRPPFRARLAKSTLGSTAFVLVATALFTASLLFALGAQVASVVRAPHAPPPNALAMDQGQSGR